MNVVIQGSDESCARAVEEGAVIVAHDTALAQAVSALHFKDIALPLVSHAQRRFALPKVVVAVRAFGDEPAVGHELAPRSLHHPVSQAGMTAEAVELF